MALSDQDNVGYRLSWGNVLRDWPLWALLAALFALAIWAYPRLPDPMPSHWNVQGQVDDYIDKPLGAFLFPTLITAIYLGMLLLPLVDPGRKNYAKFAGAYTWFRWVLVIFLSAVYLVTILYALGVPVDVGRFVQAGISLLVILLGNFLGQVRHNYFVGVRTPWTLADEEVWAKTHRLTGRLFVLAGVLGLATVYGVPRAVAAVVTIGGILAAALAGMVYSYRLFAAKRRGA